MPPLLELVLLSGRVVVASRLLRAPDELLLVLPVSSSSSPSPLHAACSAPRPTIIEETHKNVNKREERMSANLLEATRAKQCGDQQAAEKGTEQGKSSMARTIP